MGVIAEAIRRDDFDLVAPLIKEPRHFQPASGMETDYKAAVILPFDFLPGVEPELRSPIRGFGQKTPYHFTILSFGLMGAEGARRERLD